MGFIITKSLTGKIEIYGAVEELGLVTLEL